MTHLKQKAPTSLSIIEAAAKSPYRPSQLKKHTPLSSAVGMAACILLKQRCKHLCLLQVIISILLYAGHASKKVTNSKPLMSFLFLLNTVYTVSCMITSLSCN